MSYEYDMTLTCHMNTVSVMSYKYSIWIQLHEVLYSYDMTLTCSFPPFFPLPFPLFFSPFFSPAFYFSFVFSSLCFLCVAYSRIAWEIPYMCLIMNKVHHTWSYAIHKFIMFRTKHFLESSGCGTRPLETNGYLLRLTHQWYTSESMWILSQWIPAHSLVVQTGKYCSLESMDSGSFIRGTHRKVC